jgi:sulfite reductase (NADPH) flavoprotein alpha-component
MAADVDRELHQIVETAGGRTPDQAREYVEEMRKSKRYKRDVY